MNNSTKGQYFGKGFSLFSSWNSNKMSNLEEVMKKFQDKEEILKKKLQQM